MKIDLSRIGTSDFPAFVQGSSKTVSKHSLYNRIVLGIDPKPPVAARFGQLHERSTARLWLERLHGVPEADSDSLLSKVPQRVGVPGHEWLRYHAADFLALLPNDATTLIECKNRSRWAMDGFGEDGSDEVPLDIYCQLQGQLQALMVDSGSAPRDYIDVAVAVDATQFRHFVVPRDQEVGEALFAEAEKFWVDHIQKRVPPPMDGSSAADLGLAHRYPTVSEEIRGPTTAELDLVCDLRELKSKKRELDATIKKLEQELGESIGTMRGLEGEDFKIKWSERKGRVKTKDLIDEVAQRLGLRSAQRQALEDKHRGKPYRVLDVRFSD